MAAATSVLAFAVSQDEVPFDLTLLPEAETLSQHLYSSATWSTSNKQGFTTTSISPLGPEVLVAPMITEPGVEMMIGMLRDQQFGPLVVLGFGGVNIEAIDDVAYALPPFDAQTARRLVDSLRLRQLLLADPARQPGVEPGGAVGPRDRVARVRRGDRGL